MKGFYLSSLDKGFYTKGIGRAKNEVKSYLARNIECTICNYIKDMEKELVEGFINYSTKS